MGNDPSSYRVPILRLKDMLTKKSGTDGDNASQENATEAGAPQNTQQNQPAPQQQGIQPDQSRVSEEAIARAIIKPKGQPPTQPPQVPPAVQAQGVQTQPGQTAPQGQVPPQQTAPMQQPQGQTQAQMTPPEQQRQPTPQAPQNQQQPFNQQSQPFAQQPTQPQTPQPPQMQSAPAQETVQQQTPPQPTPLTPPQQTQPTPPTLEKKQESSQPPQKPAISPEPKSTTQGANEVFDIDAALGKETTVPQTPSEAPKETLTPTPAKPLAKEEKPEVPVPPLPKKEIEPAHEEIHIPIESAQKSEPVKETETQPEAPEQNKKETPITPPEKTPEPVTPPTKAEEKPVSPPTQPSTPPTAPVSTDQTLTETPITPPEKTAEKIQATSEEKVVPEVQSSAQPVPPSTPPEKEINSQQKPTEPSSPKTDTPAPAGDKTTTPTEKPKVPDTLATEQENAKAETKPSTETDDVDLQDLIGKSLALNEMETDIPKFNRKAPVKERSKEAKTPMRSFEGDSVLPTADALDIWERDAQKRKKSPPPMTKKDTAPAQMEEKPTTEKPEKPALEEKQEQKPTPAPDPKKKSIDELLDDVGTPKTYESESAKSKLLSPQKPKHTPVSNLSALRQKVLSKSASGETSSDELEIEARPRPGSKHASVIADVADKLQTMSGEGGAKQAGTETTPTQEGGGTPETEQTKPTVPHMRTFRSDVQQAVMKDKTSVVDMLSAEEKRKGLGETVRRAPRAKKTSPFSYVLMGASIMLLIAGIGVGGYFAFNYFTSDRGANTAEIIPANEYVQHDITGQSGKELLTGMNEIKNALQASLNDVTKLRVIERFDENDSTKITFVSPQEFFKKLDTRAPGSLIRTTGDRMTIGVHTLRENEPFWVFGVDQYETAFRGMLEWEDSIREDLSPYFDSSLPPIIEEVEPATSQNRTAASATSTQINDFIERPDTPQRSIDVFEDTVIANREARILKDSAGRTLLIWSIPDTKSVLIATNKASFEELVQRMTARVY